jgi:hypothetical protein
LAEFAPFAPSIVFYAHFFENMYTLYTLQICALVLAENGLGNILSNVFTFQIKKIKCAR